MAARILAGPERHAFLKRRLPGTNPRGTRIVIRRRLSGRDHGFPRWSGVRALEQLQLYET